VPCPRALPVFSSGTVALWPYHLPPGSTSAFFALNLLWRVLADRKIHCKKMLNVELVFQTDFLVFASRRFDPMMPGTKTTGTTVVGGTIIEPRVLFSTGVNRVLAVTLPSCKVC